LTEDIKVYGAKGLAWLKVEGTDLNGPIVKFLSDEEKAGILERAEATDGDLLLFVADKTSIVYDSLGALRLMLGKSLNLIDESLFNFLWITDWPLLEYDETEKRDVAAHHPFTMVHPDDVEKLQTEPESARAIAYDIVLNGYELGGDRKSTRLNSSHVSISYAVFCLKKKKRRSSARSYRNVA